MADEEADVKLLQPHPVFKEFNDYFPFDGSTDLFKQSFRGLRNIPGTAASRQAARTSAEDSPTRHGTIRKRARGTTGIPSQEDLGRSF